MKKDQIERLKKIADEALATAEETWKEVGGKLTSFSNVLVEKKAALSQIPGYPIIDEGKPQVDNFICLVADMRGSTDHLLHAISKKCCDISQLQRVFYETSVLLPTLADVIQFEGGGVTEYLGDGVLSLFRVEDPRDKAIYAAHRAAQNCLEAVDTVVNPLLKSKYRVPPLQIGIGMGYSQAVVTLVGLKDHPQPKVFGECVFRATKMSSGAGEIIVDNALNLAWPTSKTGTLKFKPWKKGDVEGFTLS